jgi:hypothetical protein
MTTGVAAPAIGQRVLGGDLARGQVETIVQRLESVEVEW